MNLGLSPALEALVHEKVASGEYRSEDEVIPDALRLLNRRDKVKLDVLLAVLDAGDADIEQGRFTEFSSDEELEAFIANL